MQLPEAVYRSMALEAERITSFETTSRSPFEDRDEMPLARPPPPVRAHTDNQKISRMQQLKDQFRKKPRPSASQSPATSSYSSVPTDSSRPTVLEDQFQSPSSFNQFQNDNNNSSSNRSNSSNNNNTTNSMTNNSSSSNNRGNSTLHRVGLSTCSLFVLDEQRADTNILSASPQELAELRAAAPKLSLRCTTDGVTCLFLDKVVAKGVVKLLEALRVKDRTNQNGGFSNYKPEQKEFFKLLAMCLEQWQDTLQLLNILETLPLSLLVQNVTTLKKQLQEFSSPKGHRKTRLKICERWKSLASSAAD
mmetsp:Transcript_5755/g.8933  ORF Transcript_5755/g.8933 Transcript_5755/m.8933 type:complete len:306 (-) Transcript_5755:49-966(-)